MSATINREPKTEEGLASRRAALARGRSRQAADSHVRRLENSTPLTAADRARVVEAAVRINLLTPGA